MALPSELLLWANKSELIYSNSNRLPELSVFKELFYQFHPQQASMAELES